MQLSHLVNSESEMLELGKYLGEAVTPGSLIFLEGELGAGKTTLARGFLRGLGYTRHVKSPTYTIVECYDEGRMPVYHFDLYRLGSPQDHDSVGFRDYLDDCSLFLLEWPECGEGFLPTPDTVISISSNFSSRKLSFSAFSHTGKALITRAQSWLSSQDKQKKKSQES